MGKQTLKLYVSVTASGNSSSLKAPFTLPSWIITQVVVAVLTALLVFLFVRLLQGKLNSFRAQELRGMIDLVVFHETVGCKMST